VIRLKHCTIEREEWGCVTRFADGLFVNSVPQWDDHHYFVASHRAGCGDDLLLYAWQHDFCHAFLAQELFDAPSPSLYGVACGKEIRAEEAAIEELAVQGFHAWIGANQEPVVGGVDWRAMKTKALEMLSAVA
jgi:hypothetical protein